MGPKGDIIIGVQRKLGGRKRRAGREKDWRYPRSEQRQSCEKVVVSEQDLQADLEVSRIRYGSSPGSESGTRYIVIEWLTVPRVAVNGEAMPVPEIETFDADFYADPFSDFRGLAKTEIHVVVRESTKAGDARPRAEVKVKGADGLKGRCIEQRSLPGIPTSPALEERVSS